jgi:hypothetical protein
MEEEVGVTDFINRIVQVLRGDLYWVKISTQNAELIKPVKL